MTIREVKRQLGSQVRFRNQRLGCDGTYMLTGCMIRPAEEGWFRYEAELMRDNHVIIANLRDIEPTEPQRKPPGRQAADNASDMLKGCICRMFVSNDPKEVRLMYESALYRIGVIADYAENRLEEKEHA